MNGEWESKIEKILANLPEIETNRLILRKMRMEDAEDIFEYASDPEVSQYTTWLPHQSIADSRHFLSFIKKRYKNAEAIDWGIVHKADKKLIGTCGFSEWVRQHNRAEIGYVISKKYWGRGYMSEAVHALLEFGFRKLKLNRIEALCQVKNIASARVMEKVGMKFEGILRQKMFVKGEYWDLKIYSILEQEFIANC